MDNENESHGIGGDFVSDFSGYGYSSFNIYSSNSAEKKSSAEKDRKSEWENIPEHSSTVENDKPLSVNGTEQKNHTKTAEEIHQNDLKTDIPTNNANVSADSLPELCDDLPCDGYLPQSEARYSDKARTLPQNVADVPHVSATRSINAEQNIQPVPEIPVVPPKASEIPPTPNPQPIQHERAIENDFTHEKRFSFRGILGVSFVTLLIIFMIALSADILTDRSKLGDTDTTVSENTVDQDNASKDEVAVKNLPKGNAVSFSELSQNTAAIVKSVKPSVVCISSVVKTRDFFNYTYESSGSGSGVIFDEDNDNIYILTNCHVVDGAESVTVSVEESDLIEARLIGKSENNDLAVIAIDKKAAKKNGVNKVQVAKLGNSDELPVGAPVIAIGNAMGEGNTATLGIVSTTAKEMTINNTKLTLIQTDAAINPGNSGGALVNGAGEVVGINTAKIVQTSVEGVGYSIPINKAKSIVENLINRQNSPALGVYVSTITEKMASAYNLPQTGVIVSGVIEDSSAADSDIHEGDVITSFNGEPVFTSEQLSDAVAKCKIGDEVKLTLVRNKRKLELTVTLKEKPNTGF